MEDRTTGSLSWVSALQLFLKAPQQEALGVAGQASVLQPAVAQHRKRLADVVLENPNAPEAWLNFLQHEEALAQQHPHLYAPPGSQHRSSLLYWYQRATEMVHRPKGQGADAYLSLWLGFARHQWCACRPAHTRRRLPAPRPSRSTSSLSPVHSSRAGLRAAGL